MPDSVSAETIRGESWPIAPRPSLPEKCECGRDRDGGLVIYDAEELLLAICVYCFRDAVRGGLSVGRIPPSGMA